MSTSVQPDSLSDHLERLLALEAEADHIRGWHPTLIPGMLQGVDYARAVIRASAPAMADEDVDERAQARAARIDALGLAAGRTARFVIGEEVLYRQVGGRTVQARQLDYLLDLLALRPSLKLHVLPAGSGLHPGLAGAFTEYQAPGRKTVFTETLAHTWSSSWPEHTLTYSRAYDHVLRQVASTAASVQLIRVARGRVAAH